MNFAPKYVPPKAEKLTQVLTSLIHKASRQPSKVAKKAGGVLCVGKAHRGSQADIKVYEEDQLSSVLADIPRLGDQAYCDQKHPEIVTPHKKPKGKELSAAQKTENKQST